MTDSSPRLRPFGLADAGLVATWLDGPGLGLPAGPVGSRWAERMVADPSVAAWMVVESGQPRGFVRLDIGPDRIAELTIAIAPGRRRCGLGTAAVQLVLGQAQRLRLRRLQAVVDPANGAALQFFAEGGFDEVAAPSRSRLFVRWIHERDRQVLEIES